MKLAVNRSIPNVSVYCTRTSTCHYGTCKEDTTHDFNEYYSVSRVTHVDELKPTTIVLSYSSVVACGGQKLNLKTSNSCLRARSALEGQYIMIATTWFHNISRAFEKSLTTIRLCSSIIM
jgi:hypothetical protein